MRIALIMEDAAESFGVTYNGAQTRTHGDKSIISFTSNKIVTGSSDGMLFTQSAESTTGSQVVHAKP